jgi:hypothetical protein
VGHASARKMSPETDGTPDYDPRVSRRLLPRRITSVLLIGMTLGACTGPNLTRRESAPSAQPSPETPPAATNPRPVNGACNVNQFAILPGEDGAGPHAIPEFDLRAIDGSECTVRFRATLTLLGSNGRPLHLRGNRSTVTLTRRLPQQPTGFGWEWSNWCGTDDVRYRLDIDDRTYEWPARIRPECDRGPSTLAPIRAWLKS